MNYATIKIREEKGKDSYWKKDVIFCADIKYLYGSGIGFCESTLKKLFQQIKDEMYL